MNNTQKIILVIVILTAIIILDLVLANITDKLIDDTENSLEILKEFLVNEDFEKSKEISKNISKKWNEYESTLSFFIEHDEIEKISTKVAIIVENASNKEFKLTLEDVVETRYLLDHVKDKAKLKLKNVF